MPQSLLGIALDYALGQWPTLEVYEAHGKIEIDNNLVENAIRPTALGKKNWLLMGVADAGERGQSFTPSSNAAGVGALIPTPTSKMC